MTPVRVLVVDDAPVVRRLITELINLHDRGWRVVAEASDGEVGVELVRSEQPDLVLLDLSMPVMDGMEALPLMREAAPDAVIVILTGFPSEAAMDGALAAGAHGYLEKDELAGGLLPRLEAILAAVRPDVRNEWRPCREPALLRTLRD